MINFSIALEINEKRSIGTYIRCAIAFNVQYLYIIGNNKFSTHGAHGSQRHIHIIHCYDWNECLQHANRGILNATGDRYEINEIIVDESDNYSRIADNVDCTSCTINDKIEICGISSKLITYNDILSNNGNITNSYNSNTDYSNNCNHISIHNKNFDRSCLFIIGENDLTEEQISLCDNIIYIPVINNEFNHLLKYESKLSICLMHFTSAFPHRYKEKLHSCEKYEIQNISSIDTKKGHKHFNKSIKNIENISLDETIDNFDFSFLTDNSKL